ncbi:single hybrid motif-containing protein [Clavulina sp. PMI_390]|nr:single hybrid motif-containing protein [Clavulina sp. PMI_390]
MPAMSPTMTEGGIASWKKQPGEAFTTGDIILEIETDKATMDVEAQDDGIMGKIIDGDGSKNIPVGKIIAMLAEEGDDISNIEVPAEESSSATTSSPAPASSSSSSSSTSSSSSEPKAASTPHPPTKITSDRPLFPSVQRLLHEHGISDANKIKGTGIRGMITKGDILTHLGLASNPWGSAKPAPASATPAAPPKEAKKPEKVYDAATVRSLILAGLTKSSATPSAPAPSATSFNDIIEGYLPPTPFTTSASATIPPPATSAKSGAEKYFDGLL